jgi:ribonuclease R
LQEASQDYFGMVGLTDRKIQISNERENSAVEAERESIKLKQIEYLYNHIGQVYTSFMSGATDSFGRDIFLI